MRNPLLFLILILFNHPLHAITCSQVTEIPQLECQALQALYNNTTGEQWTHHDGWLVDTAPSQWYGVTVQAGHVTGLGLSQNNLVGSLPEAFCELVHLQGLNLGHNQLSGTVPACFSKLTELTHLFLNNNDLQWSEPSTLCALSQLEYLELSDNPQLMTALPDCLHQLTVLSSLNLRASGLGGAIPEALCQLSNLQALKIQSNQFTGPIPACLGNLSALETLWLYHNQLTGTIPTELCQLTSLQHLGLARNQLTGEIPACLGEQLAALKILYLSYNQLSGTLPSSLGQLSQLQQLYVDHNTISGPFPQLLIDLALNDDSPLIQFHFDRNEFSFYDCPAVQQFIARDGWVDELNGWFNEGLKHSTQNYHSSGYVIDFATQCPPSNPILSLEKTGPGTVTTDQFSCGSDCEGDYELNEEVTLVATPADGSVFSVWGGDCQGVEPTTTVVMDDHKTCVAHFYETSSGTCDGVTDIPPVECEALISLYYQTGGKGWTNQQGWLTDTLANNWHGITVEAGHVTVVNLAQNGLVGMIPEPICNLSQLRKLLLGKYGYDSTNRLIGNIPSCLGDLAVLEQLILTSNELTGEIPAELGNATQLTHLDLTDNPLEGQLPEALCQLTSLEELKIGILLGEYASRNVQLTGSIPECIGEKLLNLKVLELLHAAFSGHIPSSLCNLTELTAIRFQYNYLLDGEIPSCFDKLENLVNLYLHVNKLTGVFPETLCDLTNLRYLLMSSNRFNGEIPSCLANLSELIQLTLSSNQFEGSIPAEVCQLTKLRYLYLGANSFTGELPECIGDLTDLRYLYLYYLPITKIPSSFGNLTNLSILHFYSSQLQEVIPESLINLAFSNPKLTRLTLNNNNLGTENCRQIQMLKSRGQWAQHTTFSPQRDGFDFEVDCDSYNQYILSVAKAGEGSGTVTGPGIQCDNDCVDAYDPDTEITLTAQPDTGSRFVNWSGDCQGTSSQTKVTLDADKSCVAQFATQETPTSDCNGEAATYSNQTRQAHLPCVEIPFYTDVTGQPVEALVGLYSAILEIPFGFSDFELKELNFLKIKTNETHLAARFEPQTNRLDIPSLYLETVSPFQPGEKGLPLQCQVRLQRSVLRPQVLMLEDFDCQQP